MRVSLEISTELWVLKLHCYKMRFQGYEFQNLGVPKLVLTKTWAHQVLVQQNVQKIG